MSVGGPGFINIRIKDSFLVRQLAKVKIGSQDEKKKKEKGTNKTRKTEGRKRARDIDRDADISTDSRH